MRFQIQMLLVAAMCAVLFHGAFSAPSPSSNFHDEDLMLRSDNDDNEDPDQNPILIWIAKLFVKKVGCAVAKKYVTEKCGVRELPIPLEALERLPADAVEDELDQRKFKCKAAKFITRFCK